MLLRENKTFLIYLFGYLFVLSDCSFPGIMQRQCCELHLTNCFSPPQLITFIELRFAMLGWKFINVHKLNSLCDSICMITFVFTFKMILLISVLYLLHGYTLNPGTTEIVLSTLSLQSEILWWTVILCCINYKPHRWIVWRINIGLSYKKKRRKVKWYVVIVHCHIYVMPHISSC